MIETVVVVLNQTHFRAWCIDNGRDPHDRRLLSISTANGGFERYLQGLRLDEIAVLYYGPWRQGKHWWEVQQLIRARGGATAGKPDRGRELL